MIAVCIDTNVLASGFVGITRPESTPGGVLRAWIAGRFELVVSGHILGEVADTLQEPYFRQRLTPLEIAVDISLLTTRARLTPTTVLVSNIATHPEDDLVVATAVSAQADYLVTGDRQLQKLSSYQGVAILSPREFLAVLPTLPY